MLHFKQELHALLLHNSKERMSQLPLVGLRKMGPLSRISVKAQSALRTVSYEAADKLGEAKAHLYASLKTRSSGRGEDGAEVEAYLTKQTSNNTTVETLPAHIDDEVEQENCDIERDEQGALKEAMLAYYSDHSKRHMAQLPLVGLQPLGPVSSFSVKIADSCWRLFGGETQSFLAHLALALYDTPSIHTFPLNIGGLQASSAAIVNEEFSASLVKEAMNDAVRQAQAMLKQTASDPRSVLAVFDSVSGHTGDLDNGSSTGGEQEREQLSHEKANNAQSSVIDAQLNAGRVGEIVHQFVGNKSSKETVDTG